MVQVWLEPRRLVAAGAVMALIVAAFVAGRFTQRGCTGDHIASKEHSQLIFVVRRRTLGPLRADAVSSFEDEAPNKPKANKWISRPSTASAEYLLQENLLYRQTALQEGDAGLASVLDELDARVADVRTAQVKSPVAAGERFAKD